MSTQCSSELAPIRCPLEGRGTVAKSVVGCRSTRKRTVARSIGGVSTRFVEDRGQLDR